MVCRVPGPNPSVSTLTEPRYTATRFSMIGEPPVPGCVHRTVAVPFPGVADTPSGAGGANSVAVSQGMFTTALVGLVPAVTLARLESASGGKTRTVNDTPWNTVNEAEPLPSEVASCRYNSMPDCIGVPSLNAV